MASSKHADSRGFYKTHSPTGADGGIDCSELLTAGHPRNDNTIIPGATGGCTHGEPRPPVGETFNGALVGSQPVGQEDELKSTTGQHAKVPGDGPSDPSGNPLNTNEGN